MAAPVRTGPPPPPPPPDVIAPPAPPRPTSRLELIPRELRERIYDFLFPAADLRLTNTCPPTDPALACVSRQLRAEVLPRAYDAVSIHLAWSPSSLPPQPPPQPPISSSSPSLQRAPAPLWTVARWLDPDRGGAARLALTRRLTLVIDEESGYSGSVQPERTYASSPWAAALPALSRALLCRVRRLGRLTVHVKGKKKCHAQFVECDLKAGGEGYGERYDRPRGAVFSIGPRMDDWCGFAETRNFYSLFMKDLAPGPFAESVELQGIFPRSWVPSLVCNGWHVKANLDYFMAECRLRKFWGDGDQQAKLQQLEKSLEKSGGRPSAEWETDVRLLHDALETAWKAAIVESFRLAQDHRRRLLG